METKNHKRNSTEFFVQDILYHFTEWFKRLWILILIFAVIGASGLTLYTYKTFTPKYQASATFTVNVDVKASSAESYNKATANQLAKTFPNIVTSSSLVKIISSELEISGIDASTIKANVLEDTNLFTITVTSNNPQMAYDVLQSVIANYPKVARFVIGSTQLNLIDTSSVSTMPINIPNYKNKAILGCAGGAVLGLGIILLLSLFTNTVIRSDDIVNYFNLQCLGSVTEIIKKKRSKKIENDIPSIQASTVNNKFREGIYTVRNSVIRKCKKKGYKSILVTSTISGEGKSIMSINLAYSIAIKGYSVCLVDFDLRVPSIAGYLNIDREVNSVSDYINGNADYYKCVYSTQIKNLYGVVELKNNANASELIDSDKAKELIKKLENDFEYVIIDSPPTGYLSDASVIGDYVDAAIYVVAQDVCSRTAVSKGLSTFDNVNAKVVGCVLNRITKGAESMHYGKYYRRYGKYRYEKYGKTESNDNSADELKLVNTFNGVEFED